MNKIIELLEMEYDMTRQLYNAVEAEDHANGMYFHFLALFLQEEIMQAFLRMPESKRQEYVNLVNLLTMGETLYEQHI
jgi:hypothetical protein